MAEVVLNTIGRWAATAICAAAMWFAYPQPVAAFTGLRPPAGPLFATVLVSREELALKRAPGFWLIGNNDQEEPFRSASPGAVAPSGLSRRRLSMPPLTAGYQPVSADARRAPHPSGDAVSVRAGSIRDAVTRYNEERDSGRSLPRAPNTGGRPPDPNLYRN
jgi:hypothetical protein